MKIYFMKQPALDHFKTNMDRLYVNYFQKEDNSWMEEEFGEDPFVLLKDVPGFELASLSDGSSAGEIDVENCKRVYEALKDLSESQASDERLWAGLCNGTFYKYMRKRYGYSTSGLKDKEKDATGIISRFFFSGGRRAGFYRNGLAKCWWTGRVTYDKSNMINHFEMLDILGPSDISTKVSDILYSNTFSSNPDILRGICDALKYYNDNGTKLLVRDHIRPAIQYLNAVGGAILLDVLSSDEIKDIVIEKIEEKLNGENDGLEIELDDSNEVEADIEEVKIDDSEDEDDTIQEEVVETTKDSKQDIYIINDVSEENGTELDNNDKPECVTTGCFFKVKNSKDGSEKIYHIPTGDYDSRSLELIERKMLNKSVGHRIYLMGAWYELVELSWRDDL